MDKFPARRPAGNQWAPRQGANVSMLKTASLSTPSSGRSAGAASFPQGFDSVSVPDRASVMGMGGAGGQSGRRSGNLNRGGGGGGGGKAGGGGSGGNKMVASEADKLFKLKLVEKSAEQVLSEKLKDMTYDSNACRDVSPDVAAAIVERIRKFSVEQYRLVCVVSLGSLKEKPGVQFGSRCLWNKETDNFVSVKYSNGSVYAVALIFGLFFE